MNLNELFINRRKGRGRQNVHTTAFNGGEPQMLAGQKVVMGPPKTPAPKKKNSTPSSHTRWGKNQISILNSSSKNTSKTSSTELESRIVVAVSEGRGGARCEVGIAAINISRPNLMLCQISDTQNYTNTLTKINIFNPSEIVMPLTFANKFTENRLIEKIRKHFPNMKFTGVPRNTFNKSNGIEHIQKLCIPELDAILLVLQHRFYALSAASALLTFIQEKLYIYYASGTIKVEYQESEGHAIIDVSTADILELVSSTKPAQANKYSSLFGVLNHCLTKIGARTLRSSILQPLYDVDIINQRLNCVAELIKHPEMLLSIQAILQKISNIDQLLTITTLIPESPDNCSNRHLNFILLLNVVIEFIAPLKNILENAEEAFFVDLRDILKSEDFDFIANSLRNVIHTNAQQAKGQAAVMQRCFAIKSGVNGLLDLVRKTYSERIDDMKELVNLLGQKYDLPLTLHNNNTKGYHIVLNLNQHQKRFMKKSDLPEEFIQVYRLAGSFTMKTPELINISTRIDDIVADILKISNVMVYSIIKKLKQFIGLFYKLVDGIAQLDMLQSLAEGSLAHSYVRPGFADFTEVTFAHHPLLDFLLPTKPVANTISSCKDFNIHLITGPNGSGKSIFIRQVLLLQIMAQIGCYVPAQSAIFRPADRMFARVYLEDNMECGASAFVLEMKEIKYIMNTMTENSLIIIDELCRSTSLEEGTALAMAICEKFVNSTCFLYLTTHFTLITKLHNMYCNVRTWQMETAAQVNHQDIKLDFKFHVIPGVISIKQYGLYMVQNIWPQDVLRDLYAVLDDSTVTPSGANFFCVDDKERLKYETNSIIKKLKSQKKLTEDKIVSILSEYQTKLHQLGYIFLDGNENVDDVVNFLPSCVSPSMQPWQSFEIPNYQNASGTSSYKNMSEFLQQNPENIDYLIPEVNINVSQSSNIFYSLPNESIPLSNNLFTPNQQSNPSTLNNYEKKSSDDQTELNDVQFSWPLKLDQAKTSTPLPEVDRNQSRDCSNDDFYNSSHFANPTGFNRKNDDDWQSISKEIEIYSQILLEDDDFEESLQRNLTQPNAPQNVSADKAYDSQNVPELTNSSRGSSENLGDVSNGSLMPASAKTKEDDLENHVDNDCYKSRGHYNNYISPRVAIVEGPNNSSISFGEEDVGQLYKNIAVEPQHQRTVDNFSSIQSSYYDIVEEHENRFCSSTDKTSSKKNDSFSNKRAAATPRQSTTPEENVDLSSTTTNRILVKGNVSAVDVDEGQEEFQDAVSFEKSSVQNAKCSLDENLQLNCSINAEQGSTESSGKPSGIVNTPKMQVQQNEETSRKQTRAKFNPPLKAKNAHKRKAQRKSKQDNNNKKRKLYDKTQNKFVPPRKLTKREIEEEFLEQDRKFFENTAASSCDLTKYLTQIINRPSVKQVQNTQHLALIRKTVEGVEVIPAEPKKKKDKSSFPLLRRIPSEGFDATMFSDKNAKPFEQFLNSTEKDYKAFNLNLMDNQDDFTFKPVGETFGEYTTQSVTSHFSRKISEEMSGRTSFTPDGYYKANKSDVDRIMRKYLAESVEKRTETLFGKPAPNIFETSESFYSDPDL